MASRLDCINAAARAGAAPEEAARIVDMMLGEAKALQAMGNSGRLEQLLGARVMDAAGAERLRTAQQRKMAALTIRKRAEADASIAGMMQDGATYAQALEALTVGSSGRFAGARMSVSARRMGIRGQVYGGLARELDEIPGAIKLLQRDKAFDTAVHRELLEPGSTGDAAARQVADVLTRYLEDSRVRVNDAGGNIGKLDNYAPQNHAEERMLNAGRRAWIDYVHDRLDWERSFPGVTGRAAREDVLSEVFDTITTGRDRQTTSREAGRYTPPRNMATGLSQERVLHFKDAAASLEYHEQFGRGNILSAVVGQLDRHAGKVSLMEVFGPNPEAMLRSLVEGRRKEIRTIGLEQIRGMARGKTERNLARLEKDLQTAQRAGNADKAARLALEREKALSRLRADLSKEAERLWKGHREGMIGTYFAVLNGETGSPVYPNAARIASNVRGVMSMAKLGGAFLSAFADVFVKAVNLRYNGENLLSAWKNALNIRLEAMQTHERKQFGRMLGMYAQTLINDLNTRFDAPDAPSGAMTRAMNRFFKLSGLEAWTEGHKASYAMTLSNMLGEGARGDFAAVNRDFGTTLKRYGLESRWDLVRKMARQEVDGEWHVLPERAWELTDADIEAHLPERVRESSRPVDPERLESWQYARLREQERVRRDTATSLMGFYADETRYAVLEPDEKTRAWMYGNTASGTAWGEFRRFMLQFKSFPVSYMQRILAEGRWSKASHARGFDDVPGMVHAVVSGLAFGYLAMAAKDISKGKTPRDINRPETWFAAAMQSGGLGIIGDFFLGSVDRFGNQAVGNIAGPFLTEASKLVPVVGSALRGEWRDAGEDALRLLMNNTPYVNLWYTRGALDYLLLYHMREMLSPGTLARSERKIKEEYNQTYLSIGGLDLTPSKVVKRGGGYR